MGSLNILHKFVFLSANNDFLTKLQMRRQRPVAIETEVENMDERMEEEVSSAGRVENKISSNHGKYKTPSQVAAEVECFSDKFQRSNVIFSP